MENISLNTPYKIKTSKHKRYTLHYEIPGAETIVIPKKKYGDQISCEVLWKDATGEIRQKADLMFDSNYLEPLNPMQDFILYTTWENARKVVTL